MGRRGGRYTALDLAPESLRLRSDEKARRRAGAHSPLLGPAQVRSHAAGGALERGSDSLSSPSTHCLRRNPSTTELLELWSPGMGIKSAPPTTGECDLSSPPPPPSSLSRAHTATSALSRWGVALLSNATGASLPLPPASLCCAKPLGLRTPSAALVLPFLPPHVPDGKGSSCVILG